MESGSESGSSKHLHTPPVATVGEVDLITPIEKSSFTSSDSSLDEDFFQLDGGVLGISHNEDAQLALRDAERDIPSPKFGAFDLGLPGPTYAQNFSGFTPESSLHSRSVKQIPPIQVMERSDEFDAYRIPPSVFARTKSGTPMEWSLASNESLFSIHVGNNSFSRDHVFLLGRSGELGKSGELFNFHNTKSGELINFRNTKSGELINLPNSLPLANAVADSNKMNLAMEDGLDVAGSAAETMKEVLRAAAKEYTKEKTTVEGPHHSPSISHHSYGSETSFAFPIKKRCSWLFCYCSNGSRAFCYCTWPFCYCSNGSQAFCCCSNCSRTSICSFASTTLTGGGGRSGLVKVNPEKQAHQHSQPQTPRAMPPDAAETKWFSCFCCRPYCCYLFCC